MNKRVGQECNYSQRACIQKEIDNINEGTGQGIKVNGQKIRIISN